MADLGGFSRQTFACFAARGVTQPPRDGSAVQGGGVITAGQMELVVDDQVLVEVVTSPPSHQQNHTCCASP